jgi:hypothetical protein
VNLKDNTNLVRIIPIANSLDDILKQWYSGDPQANLHRRVKFWSKLDKQGVISKTYSNRKVVIEEYELYIQTHGKTLGDKLFRQHFPTDKTGELLQQVRKARQLRKQ